MMQAGLGALASLRRRWWGAAGAAALTLLAGGVLLARHWPTDAVLRWAGLTAAVLLLGLFVLRRNLHENRPPDRAAPWPELGPANALTLLRGLAAAALAGLLALPLPLGWLPALLHAVAVFPDLLDGYVARATGRVTLLGARLDMEADSVAMLAGTLLVVRIGHAPAWFAAVGLARYLYVAGLRLRTHRGLPIHDLTPSTLRRNIAGLMMSFVSIALWPVLDPRGVSLAAVLIAAPHLAGFTRDWLVVSGAVDPAGAAYTRIHVAYERVMRIALLLLRVAGAAAAVGWLAPALWPTAPFFALIVGLAGVMLALGATPRLAALALLAATALDSVQRGYQPVHAALICTAFPVLIFGPGAWALWPRDEGWFVRKAGEQVGGGAEGQGSGRTS
jgi:CDP-diacylglycerol--glycerol-3-phosphate 3-phosphatidyltransferase